MRRHEIFRTCEKPGVRQELPATMCSVALHSYPCPCCGYFVFDEPPGSYDICHVCGWEDDVAQLRFPTEGGANRPLLECQLAFLVSLRASRRKVSATTHACERDPTWRPIDPESDEIEVPAVGVDYGTTYPDDLTTLYYWRRQRA
jgi:hypothetical protein